jgi:hypothetical protein
METIKEKSKELSACRFAEEGLHGQDHQVENSAVRQISDGSPKINPYHIDICTLAHDEA